MGFFYRAMLLIASFAPAALVGSSAAAAPRHYDCSKPGNASKAVCKKGSATTAATVAKPTKTTTVKTSKTTTTRQYDCTKAGNAKKAQCRAAAKQSPTDKTTGHVSKTRKTAATTTDCTRWYNKMRATCRATSLSAPPKTSVARASNPTAIKRRTTNAAKGGSGEAVNNNPNGAIAQCKDGSFSHAAHRAGACSRHGGVTKWLAG